MILLRRSFKAKRGGRWGRRKRRQENVKGIKERLKERTVGKREEVMKYSREEKRYMDLITKRSVGTKSEEEII